MLLRDCECKAICDSLFLLTFSDHECHFRYIKPYLKAVTHTTSYIGFSTVVFDSYEPIFYSFIHSCCRCLGSFPKIPKSKWGYPRILMYFYRTGCKLRLKA